MAGRPVAPAAGARYAECRLTPTGAAAVAAERGDGPPIALGLVLGDWFLGGRRPSFNPGRVAEAVLAAAGGQLIDAVKRLGPPTFPGGLPVRSTRIGEDRRALEYGWLVRCRVDARVDTGPTDPGLRGRPVVEIRALPPGMGEWQVTARIADIANELNRATGHSPVHQVDDESSARTGTKIRVVGAHGGDTGALASFLLTIPGVYAELDLQLPYPTADLLESWIRVHGAPAAVAGAELLAGLSG